MIAVYQIGRQKNFDMFGANKQLLSFHMSSFFVVIYQCQFGSKHGCGGGGGHDPECVNLSVPRLLIATAIRSMKILRY